MFICVLTSCVIISSQSPFTIPSGTSCKITNIHLKFQVCTIEMTMDGRDRETVMLLPHMLNMVLSPSNDPQLDPVDLPLFNIIGWQLTQRNSDCPKEGIRMVVLLRRKAFREVITTYLPTILLMMTTYVTTFFKSEYFEAALGVNLTSMLMMTTIFMTSLSELTDTAYPKWIDAWLIFCQIVPFIVVVLSTLKEAYRDEGEADRSEITREPSEEETATEDIEEVKVTVPTRPGRVEAWKEAWKKPRGTLYWIRIVGKKAL